MDKTKPENEPIIIVSGLPRSGTSMLMRMLEAGGMEILTDQIRKADDDNPKGYFEFERAKKLPKGDFAWLPEARGKVVKVISALLQYLPENYEYRVLFIERALTEVLASQRQMLINRGKESDKVNDAEMIRLYQHHLANVRYWLANNNNFDVLGISYHQFFESPDLIIRKINLFLGGGLEILKMRDVIDPSLYRQRIDRSQKR